MFYGVTRETQIVEMVRDVCESLSLQTKRQGTEMVIGTICAETGLGNTRDKFEREGRGLTQFDEVRFNDVRKYICERRPELRTMIIERFGIDFAKIGFSLIIDYSPIVSIILCRVSYMMVPEKLPNCGDVLSQAKYWKKYHNTSAGKGTPEHYMRMWNRFAADMRI